MLSIRQIMSAVVAAAVVWAGVVAAEPAHAHGLSADHADVIHALAVDADADHHAVTTHHHDAAPADDGDGSTPDHDGAVFHVHGPCFVALAAEHLTFRHVAILHEVTPAELVESFRKRSTAPPDRPPRSFL